MTKDASPKDGRPSELAELKRTDYERIGRALESVVLHGYSTKRRLFYMNFWRGLFFGIGSTIGATVVIVILIYIFSAFSNLPVIGDLFESLEQGVEQQSQFESGSSGQ